jgi:hypothetical protein
MQFIDRSRAARNMTDDAPNPTMNRTEHQKEIQNQTNVESCQIPPLQITKAENVDEIPLHA